jgi:predicted Zn-dependent protease
MVDDDVAERLVSASRTAIGDEVRSVTYFTGESVEQLYLREDLERTADLVGFAEVERLGFRARTDYRRTELGEYRFTTRVFDEGYLLRVIAGDQGVFVTTDTMSRNRFEEVATSVRSVLSG